jgi:SAM-dependent methyltransferase
MNDAASASGTWDRHAVRYGAQERLELRAIDAAIRLAAVDADERVVDLATGTGLLLRRLATSRSRPREAVGVDRSAGMLEHVGMLPAGWSTLLAPADAVPLPDGWADAVTCAYMLGLLPPAARGAVLAEARRLLAPTARARLVVVTVWADPRRAGGRLAHGALRLAARSRPAAWGGLLALDPSRELIESGFALTRRAVLLRGGYPSLVVAARPASRSS